MPLRTTWCGFCGSPPGGEPIFRAYYPNQYVFSREPLPSLDSYEGKNIRQHSTILGDLLAGLGAEGQFRGLLRTCTPPWSAASWTPESPAARRATANAWYEVTDYLYGPIVGSVGVTYVTVNGEKWAELSRRSQPADSQRKWAREFDVENRRLAEGSMGPGRH